MYVDIAGVSHHVGYVIGDRSQFNGLTSHLRAHCSRLGLPAYTVADIAPSTHIELMQCYNETGRLVIWAGASHGTVWGGPADNWLFRAWHDSCHLWSGMCDKVDCFTVDNEIELAGFQARGLGDMFGKMIDIEIAGQARHFQQTGRFVADQRAFAAELLRGR